MQPEIFGGIAANYMVLRTILAATITALRALFYCIQGASPLVNTPKISCFSGASHHFNAANIWLYLQLKWCCAPL